MQEDKRLKRKVRSSYAISTVSITLVLFLLGSVGYLILTAMGATDQMKESVEVYVMLENELTSQDKESVKARLLACDGVKEADYKSKEDEARKFIESTDSNFEMLLDVNPLFDQYAVRFEAGAMNKENLARFEKKVGEWEEVHEVVYHKGDFIEQVGTGINKFNIVLMAFGAALLAISVILLNNTIRVSIFAKRYAISTMKLVGATPWFIMRPFLRNSVSQGVCAGLIAVLMFGALVWGLNEGLPEVRFGADRTQLLCIAGGMLVGGVLISLIFTTFAVRKFIKLPTNAVHYY